MKSLSKSIGALVIAASILSTGIVAMAAGDSTATAKSTSNTTKAAGKVIKGERRGKGGFDKGAIKNNSEDNLKALVSAGVITQEESDKILALSKEEAAARQAERDKVKNMTEEQRKAYLDTLMDKSKGVKEDLFTQAVTKGIITQEKADAAKAKLKETRTAERKAAVTEELKALVTAKTITQEQADKIVKYIDTLEANKPAKDSSAASEQKQEKTNPLNALVTDGTLTQAQLDEVSKVVHFGGRHGHGGHGHKGANTQTTAPAASTSTTQAN